MQRFLLFLIFLLIVSNTIAQKTNDKLYDSLLSYRDQAENTELAMEERFQSARNAIQISLEIQEDTTILKSNRVLSYLFIQNADYDSLYKINHINLKLASNLEDTLKMGYASNNIAFYFDVNNKLDSAYYYYFEAKKYYSSIGEKRSVVSTLLNMANIQETGRDFIGSEINAIAAINILKELPSSNENNYTLWSLNNLIGIVSEQVERYDEAIVYHNKALDNIKGLSDSYTENLYSKNNIAILYRRKGEYKKAIDLFEKLLEDKSLIEKDRATFASLSSNLAYSRFLNNNYDASSIEAAFDDALKILKEEEDLPEIMSAYEYLSEFYLKEKANDSALVYANKAYEIALDISDNQARLNTLRLKAKIKKDEKPEEYLNEYIRLSDSLLLQERVLKNKFARVEFETDEIKAENEQISKERLLFLILSIGLFMTLTLIYIIITQRSKNKELKFIQQQQETNEEIYNLMLSQQDQIEEARTLEKRRISEELHDGILGRLFGTRLSLDSLNMSTTEEAIKSRENYIDELQAIEQEIRKVSHELNTDFVSGSGFKDIIKTLLETQTKAYKLDYVFNSNDSIHWDAINNKTKIHIYRILQESLQNIYKHANATNVEISINLKNNVICIAIKDDGSGFDINKSKKGIGIKNITSRVNEINGELNIQSEINKGTNITITVPI